MYKLYSRHNSCSCTQTIPLCTPDYHQLIMDTMAAAALDMGDNAVAGILSDLDDEDLADVDYGEELDDEDLVDVDYGEDDDTEAMDHNAFMAEIDAKDAALEQRHRNLMSRQQQLISWIGSKQHTLEVKASELAVSTSASVTTTTEHPDASHVAAATAVSISAHTSPPSVPVDSGIALRPAGAADTEAILSVVNDAAIAYKGVIPEESWHEPYMGRDELITDTTQAGVNFHLAVTASSGDVVSVMGIQRRCLGPHDGWDDACARAIRMPKVTLIRHAYTRTAYQRRGLGRRLLRHLLDQASTPTLIGTWAATTWAIRFYEKVRVEGKGIGKGSGMREVIAVRSRILVLVQKKIVNRSFYACDIR